MYMMVFKEIAEKIYGMFDEQKAETIEVRKSVDNQTKLLTTAIGNLRTAINNLSDGNKETNTRLEKNKV